MFEHTFPFGSGYLVVYARHSHAELVVDSSLVIGGGIDDEDQWRRREVSLRTMRFQVCRDDGAQSKATRKD